jgi:hypothetical protein
MGSRAVSARQDRQFARITCEAERGHRTARDPSKCHFRRLPNLYPRYAVDMLTRAGGFRARVNAHREAGSRAALSALPPLRGGGREHGPGPGSRRFQPADQ